MIEPVRRQITLLIAVALAALLLAGCAGKAQTLQLAAAQFEMESLAAIDGIEQAINAETAPPVRSDTESSQEFVDLIMGFEGPLTADVIGIALDPNAVELGTAGTRQSEFLQSLRVQYAEFAAIFDRLDQGSFFARNKVDAAGPLAEKLTAQLISFARLYEAHPPRFLQQRSQLTLELKIVHSFPKPPQGVDPGPQKSALARYGLAIGADLPREEIARAIALWRERWLAVLTEERRLTEQVIARCLKAAVIGAELRRQIMSYNDLTLADITEAMGRALDVAGRLTGEDFAGLQSSILEIEANINADPNWKAATDALLQKANAERDAKRAAKSTQVPKPTNG